MPLPLPDLDDRRWTDLVDEARAMIHPHAPGWTDYNLSDPGITLLDLFAWVAESEVFAIDRIPRRHRARFLALVGVAMRDVVPATTPLQLTSPGGPLALPAGVVFAASDADTTVQHCLSTPVEVLGCALGAVQVWTGAEYLDRTQDWRHRAPFSALGPDPGRDAALLLGLDPSPVVDVAARLSLWLTLEDDAKSPADGVPGTTHHSARTVWEYHDGNDWRTFGGAVVDETRSLTRSGRVVLPFGEVGVASASVGSVTQPQRWIRVRVDAGRHDVAPRARSVLVDAAPVVQAVPAYQTWHLADAAMGLPPGFVVGTEVRFGLRLDPRSRVLEFTAPAPEDPRALVVAATSGAVTLTLRGGGVADGAPSFESTVEGAPFRASGVEIWTSDSAGTRRWGVVETLDRSKAGDLHAEFDAATGTVRFGDGEHGRIPPAGSTVVIRAEATSVGAGTPSARAEWRLDVRSPLTAALLAPTPVAAADVLVRAAPATAARPADDLEAAEGRAADQVWAHERLVELVPDGAEPTLDQLDRRMVLARSRPDRAVTTIDFERLALDVPGTAVLRARAWAGIDPAMPGFAAPGTVSVVVVPGLPSARPTPTPALLAEVRRFLCPRRTLGTRLVVTGPDYVEVTVRATIRAKPMVDAVRVATNAQARLSAFLHPLTGGPAARGWPFGRDVYQAEVLRELDLVDGVDHVEHVDLRAHGTVADCGNVCVGPLSLVVSGAHEVIVQ